jgi:predicted RNase H-like HicB family nuclease
MKNYHINLFFSKEDQGYIADIPDLSFCSACGETPEEALQEVLKAQKAWIEVAISENKPAPEPKYMPLIIKSISFENL